MSDPFIRTEAALEECEQHLTGSDLFGSPIESYLTEHILVILCAEMQQAICHAVEARAAVTGDLVLTSFTGECAKRIIRSLKKSELSGIIAMFGSANKDHFNNAISDSEATIYSNAVRERHIIAHVRATTVTFAQLRSALQAARKILTAFESAIQI